MEAQYANLYYACNRCNDIKSNRWPSAEDLDREEGWIDPCESDFIPDHFDERPDGHLHPKTNAARYTLDNLHLNLRTYLIQMRLERKRLMDEIEETTKLVNRIDSSADPEMEKAIRDHLRLCEELLSHY